MSDALRAGLRDHRIATATRPDRLEPVALGKVAAPRDLDMVLPLADQLEDEELARKIRLRK